MKHLALFFLFLAPAFTGFGQAKKPAVTRYLFQVNTQAITHLPVDTALAGSQMHQPLYPDFSSWSDLGNTGLPALINHYRPVREALNPLLFEGSDGYGTTTPNLEFYSANSPFSMLNYNSGGVADKNGQTLKALFARNLKNKGNITFLGKYMNSDGHFSNQKGNSSVFHVNYILNRKNYSLITGISRHSFGFAENGGLESDSDLGTSQAEFLGVNLSGADSKMSMLTWQGIQTASFHPGRKQKPTPAADSTRHDSLPVAYPVKNPIRISHTFRLSNISRRYTDTKSDSGFYRNTYSANGITNDSMKFLSFTNNISFLSDTLRAGKFPLLAQGGINPDFYRYQYADSASIGFGIGLNGKIRKEEPFSRMELAGTWYAAGYPAGDFNLSASWNFIPSKKEGGSEITVQLYTRGCSPDPIIQEYRSNHFNWSNDFFRQKESGLRLVWNIPRIKASLEGNLVTNKGWIYFDTLGLPAQLNGRMSVASLRGSKKFSAGIFRSSVSAMVQYSTSDKIRLPLFTGSTSTYLHHDILFPKTKGLLEVEYGFDLNYSTRFYGYAYMPATGVFYSENEKLLGNYPYLNVFVQMKVKRTRIFVEWCQTFADLLPEQSFAVLHYPSMRPHLKYGIYWHFYD
jgi:hypothetical protein